MYERLILAQERPTDVCIGYLSEGSGAPSWVLIVSWNSLEACQEAMDRIRRCGAWSVVNEEHTLMILGRGEMVVGTSGDVVAQAIFWSSWYVEDEYVTSLFATIARGQGYFLLLPAIDKRVIAGEPVFCPLA